MTAMLIASNVVLLLGTLFFAWQWWREIDRHAATRRFLDVAHQRIKSLAVAAHPRLVGDAMFDRLVKERRGGVRLADEQQMVRAIADDRHHSLKDVS